MFSDELKTYIINLIHDVEKQNQSQKEWLNLSEVCEFFHLPKNNVKNRKWRDKTNFPYYQASGIYGNVVYSRSEVEAWLKAKQVKKC